MSDKKPDKNKALFYIQLALFLIFFIILPLTYTIIKYKPFQMVQKTKIGIAELIVCIMVFVLVSLFIKFYLDGMKTKWSWFKQILLGILKVILPMLILYLIVFILKDHTDVLLDVLTITIPSELIAIIVNPLPKWAFDNNVDGLGIIVDKIFKTKNKGYFDSEGE